MPCDGIATGAITAATDLSCPPSREDLHAAKPIGIISPTLKEAFIPQTDQLPKSMENLHFPNCLFWFILRSIGQD